MCAPTLTCAAHLQTFDQQLAARWCLTLNSDQLMQRKRSVYANLIACSPHRLTFAGSRCAHQPAAAPAEAGCGHRGGYPWAGAGHSGAWRAQPGTCEEQFLLFAALNWVPASLLPGLRCQAVRTAVLGAAAGPRLQRSGSAAEGLYWGHALASGTLLWPNAVSLGGACRMLLQQGIAQHSCCLAAQQQHCSAHQFACRWHGHQSVQPASCQTHGAAVHGLHNFFWPSLPISFVADPHVHGAPHGPSVSSACPAIGPQPL